MKSTRIERTGWYFYDWANSAFYTTVVTVFLGPYLTGITENAADANGFVSILGIPVYHGSFFAYVVSLSVLLQVFILPLAGSVADMTGRKKTILGAFAYLGAFSTMGLYFLEGSNYLLGGALFIIANLSFGVSVVVYNSFLGDISTVEKRDAVSSIGWAFGYLGGGIVLALNLALYSSAESLGIGEGMAVRISLCSAGAWWALFSIVPMITLRRGTRPIFTSERSTLKSGFNQLWSTIKDARNYPQTMLFLIAYLLYNDGVQAVIVLAAQFGHEELGLGQDVLIQSILMVQFVAFFGALLFNFLAKKTGSVRAVLISLVIWAGTVIYAYGFLYSVTGFFILAAVIAIVLGGTQAISRSIYSMIIPKGREAAYFSVYEVSERGTSWIGPLFFGLALQLTGSYRIAILSLIVFFAAGFILLLKLNLKKAIAEAEQG